MSVLGPSCLVIHENRVKARQGPQQRQGEEGELASLNIDDVPQDGKQ
jgi:hypothetical protein